MWVGPRLGMGCYHFENKVSITSDGYKSSSSSHNASLAGFLSSFKQRQMTRCTSVLMFSLPFSIHKQFIWQQPGLYSHNLFTENQMLQLSKKPKFSINNYLIWSKMQSCWLSERADIYVATLWRLTFFQVFFLLHVLCWRDFARFNLLKVESKL